MKRITLNIFIITLAFLFSSCAYGPKTERKSPLNHLNGEHYQTPTVKVISPLLILRNKRKDKPSKIEGAVVVKGELFDSPLRYIQIGFFNKDNQQLFTTTTDNAGNFSHESVVKNGTYKLRILGSKYKGEIKVIIESYTVKELKIFATQL